MAKTGGPVKRLREKAKAQGTLYARGGFKRFSEESGPNDRRNGGSVWFETEDKVALRAVSATIPCGKEILKVAAGHASGLSRDIGRVGKARCEYNRATYGNGTRNHMRRDGLVSEAIVSPDIYADWPLYRPV